MNINFIIYFLTITITIYFVRSVGRSVDMCVCFLFRFLSLLSLNFSTFFYDIACNTYYVYLQLVRRKEKTNGATQLN